MSAPSRFRSGRHFLQIPGPTNVPDRVLRAMAQPVIDHRGPDFARLSLEILEHLRGVFNTNGPVLIFPSSGTGACEAAYVNTLSAGDRVLICETGWFSQVPWRRVAERLGLTIDDLAGRWGTGASPSAIEARLKDDRSHAIKAVVVVHNETSTGVTSRIREIRQAIDRARHPALLIVDTISSLASIEYRHDDWQVDVAVSSSQKGLMLPPGLSFVALSEKALAASRRATLPRSYFDWTEALAANTTGFFPYTPATTLFYGLRESLLMLREEGLPNVFARHARLAAATRAAVDAWNLQMLCEDPAEYSNVLTTVVMPAGHDADAFRQLVLDAFDMSLGTGLGKLSGKVFRIGHVGWFNELMLAGTLSGIEMGLRLAGVPHTAGGVLAALDHFAPRPKRVEPATVIH